MDSKELLKFCLEKGLLLDKEVLSLLSGVTDVESAKLIVKNIKEQTGKKIITKNVFYDDKEKTDQFFYGLPKESQKNLEKLKIKLGLSIEISKEISKEKSKEIHVLDIKENMRNLNEEIKILNTKFPDSKKVEVKDFITYFRNRLIKMQKILQAHSELNNLVSIDKIHGDRKEFSIIGLVADKRVTKNGNMLIDIEDLTGKIKVLINKDKAELFETAEKITLDSVLGFKGNGNREILFVKGIIFPESILFERKKASVEEYAAFISDVHIGSKLFFEKEFLKFIDYLNGKVPNTPEVSKIKYLFIGGDLIVGVGIYPNQEKHLYLSDLESQYQRAAELLGKIRSDIKIIVCSGNHDGIRIMEPQPKISEKYGWPLYNLKNLTIVQNPSMINIASTKDFSGFNVLMYHGYSYPYYAGAISYLIKAKAVHNPEMIMEYLLKNRHLAPTHGSTQYFPSEEDHGIIENVPDIFLSGHTHKSGIAYYNNVLAISGAAWEKITPYHEKLGFKPDYCKVPLLNLKTRAIKILDFE